MMPFAWVTDEDEIFLLDQLPDDATGTVYDLGEVEREQEDVLTAANAGPDGC